MFLQARQALQAQKNFRDPIITVEPITAAEGGRGRGGRGELQERMEKPKGRSGGPASASASGNENEPKTVIGIVRI